MEKRCLSANGLKLIAIVAMTIDHIADLLYPCSANGAIPIILHIIGRLTAPIMWFFICEGFYYTHNLKKYLCRMFLFSLVSHFAYCFAFGINFIPFYDGIRECSFSGFLGQTSVIWTLAWALVALWVLHKSQFKHWQKMILLFLICVITFPADWSCIAVMAIIAMYDRRGHLKKQMLAMELWVLGYAIVYFFCLNKIYALVQLCVILVWLPLSQYNGKKGGMPWMKWFFYIYYPAHLILIGVFRLVLYGNIPILF